MTPSYRDATERGEGVVLYECHSLDAKILASSPELCCGQPKYLLMSTCFWKKRPVPSAGHCISSTEDRSPRGIPDRLREIPPLFFICSILGDFNIEICIANPLMLILCKTSALAVVYSFLSSFSETHQSSLTRVSIIALSVINYC